MHLNDASVHSLQNQEKANISTSDERGFIRMDDYKNDQAIRETENMNSCITNYKSNLDHESRG